MRTAISHRPLAPFGIEVDVDLTSPLSDADENELRRLYAADGLLLFRNQSLTMDQQLDACSIFGPVLRDHIENYIVSNVREDGLLGNKELLFHNDIPFVPGPYLGGSLHALAVEEGASPTRFASAFRAYERLPQRLRDRIEGLNALQVRERAEGRRTRLADLQPLDNCAVHKVVGRQEGTERPYIFVNFDMTGCITSLPEAESDALLEELFAYLYDEDFIYDHRWRAGDLVIWNNLAIQHARHAVGAGERTLQRVTIAQYGYWDQCPVDLPTFDRLLTINQPAMMS
jgi:taurine dioxygenase